MAITVTQLGTAVFTTTTGNKTLVATPNLADIIVVIAAATGPTGASQSISDNNTDNHGASGFYNTIVNVLKNTSADVMTAWVRSDPIQSATSTTWTATQASSSGGGLAVFAIRGATIVGPALIRGSGSQANQTTTAAPAPVLSQAALTANAVMTAVFCSTSPPGLTSPTGFVAAPGDVNLGYTVPTSGLAVTHANSGITASTITWGSTPVTTWCSLAFELAADQGNLAVSPEIPDIQAQQAVKRGAFFMSKWQKRRSGLFAPEPGILVPA